MSKHMSDTRVKEGETCSKNGSVSMYLTVQPRDKFRNERKDLQIKFHNTQVLKEDKNSYASKWNETKPVINVLSINTDYFPSKLSKVA